MTARDTDTSTRGQALQCTERHQLFDALCQRLQPADARVNMAMPHSTTGCVKTVRQGAMEQVHERKAEQVRRKCLLHFDRTGVQCTSDAENAGR